MGKPIEETGRDKNNPGIKQDAKKAKNFAEADRIRDELKAAGIEVTDIPHGAKWKRI